MVVVVVLVNCPNLAAPASALEALCVCVTWERERKGGRFLPQISLPKFVWFFSELHLSPTPTLTPSLSLSLCCSALTLGEAAAKTLGVHSAQLAYRSGNNKKHKEKWLRKLKSIKTTATASVKTKTGTRKEWERKIEGDRGGKSASAQPKKGFESTTTTKTRKQLVYAAFTVSMRDESGEEGNPV